MRIKRLLEARRLTQARANKELCVTFVFTGNPPQGKDQITRIAHKERGMQNPL